MKQGSICYPSQGYIIGDMCCYDCCCYHTLAPIFCRLLSDICNTRHITATHLASYSACSLSCAGVGDTPSGSGWSIHEGFSSASATNWSDLRASSWPFIMSRSARAPASAPAAACSALGTRSNASSVGRQQQQESFRRCYMRGLPSLRALAHVLRSRTFRGGCAARARQHLPPLPPAVCSAEEAGHKSASSGKLWRLLACHHTRDV